jgi:Tfp pilus assembly protein PilO
LIIDLAGAVVLVLLSIFLYQAVLSRIWRDAHEGKQLSVQVSSQKSKIDGLFRTRKQLDSQIARIEQEVQSTRIKLEPASQVNQRLAAITRVAERSGLRIDLLEPGRIDGGGDGKQSFGMQAIRMSGQGRYRNCHAFMRRLRSELPDLSIQGFTLISDGGANSPAVTFTMDLIWFTEPTAPVVSLPTK